MKFIRSISQLRKHHQNCVATIGNFDGVHLGHQAVFKQLATKAAELQLPMVAMIFEPQAQEFFLPDKAPARLTRLREKLLALRRYTSIDQVLCLNFNKKFATLSAEDFIQQVLVDGLKIQHLVIGDDFRFGKQRKGDFKLLQKYSSFTVENSYTFKIDDQRVSSTRIRQTLKQDNFKEASKLLGRPFTMCGRIAYGKQLGRTIGFATANIVLHNRISPLKGIFAVKIHGITEKPLLGAASIGTNPAVNGKELLLEVHIFNFDQNIYGCYIEIEFIQKIRDEENFPNLEQLKQRIKLDVKIAKQILLLS
ncbi:bifunctional riboflavin kinase/FAD synthetase [Candidatus Marithrix sp. Canyon 246]|uniref:bifunctional riboflavin kinase/FAD synthetase n=1 Tax=Candidatus Marithrix sp. Canyon 246 TaxID=1827136 RepID=UPI00084A0A16|nr:bifunctional riboflavin kinase/FAD synthetase [Candidatus Marithrix sp. Canyon 246]